jgi:predicted nucleotidyltransferase
MRPDARKIDELVRRIVEAAHPLRIVLFGSAARGDMGPDSDIDVLVVVREDIDRTRAARSIRRGLIGFDLPVDLVLATEDDLGRLRDNFSLVYYWALREGTSVYAA